MNEAENPNQEHIPDCDAIIRMHPHIVVFDGVCNFCDAAVNWLIDHDHADRLVFAALQSPSGAALANRYGVQNLTTVVYIDHGRAYFRSPAALHILTTLDFPWSLLGACWIVPRPLRDMGYRWFATHRYGWFGKREECRIPTAALRARFLDRS